MRITTVIVIALLVTALSACTAIQIGGELVLNQDGSGSRSYVMHIFDSDNEDGYGNAIRYIRLQGNALRARVENTLRSRLNDISWLTVSVGSGRGLASSGLWTDVQTLTIAFNFTSFEDYVAKKTRLAMLGANVLPEDSLFIPPTLTGTDDVFRYKEDADTTLWTIRPLFLAMIDDPEVFDFTAGGTNTVATMDELLFYGIEMKSVQISLVLGANEPFSIISGDNINEMFSMSGGDFTWMREPTELILHYDFNDNTQNHGIAGSAADLRLGEGSSMSRVTFTNGINGRGLLLDGTTYLTTPSAFTLNEFSISFYVNVTEFIETDTGSNTIMVCNGLGALAPGALDVIFLRDRDDPGRPVRFISKTNGTSWMNQDRMHTDAFFNNRLNEWHHFVLVYENDYDDEGYFDVSYITLYIDGIRYGMIEQYVAAGLDKQLGVRSTDEAVSQSGFSVGGYFEAGIVKRGLRGILDDIKVFNGPLSQAEVEELYRANPVSRVFDPSDSTNQDITTIRAAWSGPGTTVIIVVIVLIALAACTLVIIRKKKKAVT